MEEKNSAKAKQQQHSTRNAEHSRNATMEKSKGKVEEEKCECKVYVEVFLEKKSVYKWSKATQILLCVCYIPKQCYTASLNNAKLESYKLKPCKLQAPATEKAEAPASPEASREAWPVSPALWASPTWPYLAITVGESHVAWVSPFALATLSSLPPTWLISLLLLAALSSFHLCRQWVWRVQPCRQWQWRLQPNNRPPPSFLLKQTPIRK